MAKSTIPKATAGTKPARIKTAVYLTPDQYQSLGAYCLKESDTQSDIIGRLITQNLSGYYVAVRGPGMKDKDKSPPEKAPAEKDSGSASQADSGLPAIPDESAVSADGVNAMATAAA